MTAARSALLAASLCLGCAAPAAAADSVSFQLAPKTTKALKRANVKLSATKPATKAGKVVTVPLAGTLTTNGTTPAAAKAGVRLKAGKRKVRVTATGVTIGAKSSLGVRVGKRSFVLPLSFAKATVAGNQLQNVRLKVGKPFAKAVNKKLKRKAVKAGRFGVAALTFTATTPAVPSPTPQPTPTPEPTVTPAPTETPGPVVIQPPGGVEIVVGPEVVAVAVEGGVVIGIPGLSDLVIDNPSVTTTIVENGNGGLYATLGGVRVKLGDIDTNELQLGREGDLVTLQGLQVQLSNIALLVPLLGLLDTLGLQPVPLELELPSNLVPPKPGA